MGFIGYDYAKALEDDATVDAAIDRAVALYLDIINLFIRILEIMGKK
jgi:FtsH-binding integral membrane protein